MFRRLSPTNWVCLKRNGTELVKHPSITGQERCGDHQGSLNDGAKLHPRRNFQFRKHDREVGECIRHEGNYFKGRPCSSLFEIEMNCLWHQSRYFSDISCIYIYIYIYIYIEKRRKRKEKYI